LLSDPDDAGGRSWIELVMKEGESPGFSGLSLVV
jgi:hypothetical protein